MRPDYKIKIDVFEGPLDLLLYLVRKEELDLYDVFIEKITRQYLDYLDTFRFLDLDIAGEFVVMAANLIYIKSRNLLPKDQQTPEEESEEEDPRWTLVRQLIEYKKFKDAALELQKLELAQEGLIMRAPVVSETNSVENLLKSEVGIFDLIRAFQIVLEKQERKLQDFPEILEENFTVSEKIEHIVRLIRPGRAIGFSDLFESAADRTEIVVTFLALLELIRLKQVRVRQESLFAEMEIWGGVEGVRGRELN